VLSLGHFVDQAPYTNSYDWMKIYYLSTRQRQEDYLTTPDYLWRYDKGVTSHHPKSAIGRFFLRRFMGSTQTLQLAENLRWLLDDERPTFTLDVFLPVSRMKAFTDWYAKEFQFYPVWVVPYARVRDYAWLTEEWYAGTNDKLFIDLAIYGMKQRGHTNYYKLMEDKLLELGGVKTLISHNYYSEEDFWKTWNKRNYDQVKARTDPQNIFRNLYTKTCRAVRGLPE
jgi:FAD/FMN-containing dehydrogenase